MRHVTVAALVVGLLACGPGGATTPVAHVSRAASPSPLASPTPPSPSPSPPPSPADTATPSPFLYLQIVQSDYGFLSVQTAPGATCTATATLPNGSAADGLGNPQVAGTDGMAQWVYPQPPTDQGSGVHRASCSKDGLSASNWATFEVGD